MEISILEKKHLLIKNIINSKDEELIDTIDLFFDKSDLDIPIEVQELVLKRYEELKINPNLLVSESEFDEYLNSI